MRVFEIDDIPTCDSSESRLLNARAHVDLVDFCVESRSLTAKKVPMQGDVYSPCISMKVPLQLQHGKQCT